MQGPAETRGAQRPSPADQAGALAAALQEEFGVPFRVYDPEARPLAGDGPAGDAGDERRRTPALSAREQARVTDLSAGGFELAVSMHDAGRPSLVAFGRIEPLGRPGDPRERDRVGKWLRAVHDRLARAGRPRPDTPRDPAASAPWDAVLRLEQLLRHQKVDQDLGKARRQLLEVVAHLVGASATAFVPQRADDPVVTAGEPLLSPWDCTQIPAVLAECPGGKAGFVVLNDPPPTSGSVGQLPGVKNLLALPVTDRGGQGWLIVMNKLSRPTSPGQAPGADAPTQPPQVVPFRKVDAALLTPFAALLGYQDRADQRYQHLRDLLVGLTRSLTAAIDAKDSYTYGHSERVARVAVELGRELGLREDELSDIYLAGLLHDIGKIGIRDSVLCKRGPLTDEEFEHIKEHVTIGYRILNDLKAIGHLIPGVLHHHERFDGQGYPAGLAGKSIPYLARILSVADSYDAMSTSRPYRAALSCERVEQVLVAGADVQWDRTVVEAFLRCKPKVQAIIQRGLGESLTGALDGAIRRGSDRQELLSMAIRPGSSLGPEAPDGTH